MQRLRGTLGVLVTGGLVTGSLTVLFRGLRAGRADMTENLERLEQLHRSIRFFDWAS